jgi:hypothetical protein
MRKNLMLGVLVLCVALVATGCAKPPQAEFDSAAAAVSSASAEAQKYAADAYTKSQDALNAVKAEMEAQNAKFALFRSYTKTKELIAAANAAAAEATTAAAAGKETARNESAAAVQAAKDAVTTAQTSMTALDACPRKPKGYAKDMEMLKASWDSLNSQVAALDANMAAEDYLGAKSAADALKGQADTLNTDLMAAKEKIKC